MAGYISRHKFGNNILGRVDGELYYIIWEPKTTNNILQYAIQNMYVLTRKQYDDIKNMLGPGNVIDSLTKEYLETDYKKIKQYLRRNYVKTNNL